MADLSQFNPDPETVESQAERFLFASFSIGADIEEFLRTDAGKYLQGVAVQDIAEAIQAFLGAVDVRRSIDEIARAHQKANRARQAFLWMLEAMQQGVQAEYQLKEMDTHERR